MTAAATLALVVVALALTAAVRRAGGTTALQALSARAVSPSSSPEARLRTGETDGTLRRGPGRPPAARRPAPGTGAAGLAGAVLVPIAMLAWVNSTTGFVWDDIKNLRQAQVQGLSLRYLMEPTSGHWAPGHRLADWLLERYFPFNLAASQIITLAGFAIALLLFHRILAALAGPGRGPLLMTLLFGASVVNVGVTQWWASAMDRVPATIGSFIAIFAYVRFARTRDWRWLALSVAGLAAAFCFYVKPVFVPLYLVLARVLLIEPERRLRDTFVATLRDWRVWLVYAVTTGLFAVVYVSTYPTELSERPTPGMLVEYLSTLWFRVVAPNLFGIYVPIDSVSAVGRAGIVLSQVLFVAAVVVSIVRWRPAWRAWAFFGVGFAVNAVVIAQTRLGPFPIDNIAYTLFYNLEITWLFFLAAGFAFFRRTVGAAETPPVEAPRHARRRNLADLVVAAGVAAYLALSFRGAIVISEPKYWIGAQARIYLDNVAAGLRSAQPGNGDVVFVDGVVPENIVPHFLGAYNSDSEVLPLLDEAVSFDARGRSRMFDFDRTGRMRPVRFVPLAGGTAGQLLVSGRLEVVGAETRSAPPDGGVCVAHPEGASIAFTPPEPLVSGDGLYLDLRFTSSTGGTMSLVVEPIQESAPPGPQAFRVVHLHRVGQETVYELDHNTVRRLSVVVAPGVRLCLHHLYAGRVVPP